ncbi:MAG TPA: transcription antitermination factor NusB [Gemmatimonadaceae bacterium]|nr:transcription antitermination factor NusB [Gemmatimonadaceae bacterium]
MRVETRARARALQALYAWDVRGAGTEGNAALERVAEHVWDDLVIPPPVRERAWQLIRTVNADGRSIDAELEDVTTNWRLERLGAVERSILRLGAAELQVGETPPRVVVQESVRLAERFAGEDSARFVNGVLDALARKLGKL